ncbi:unnamed protein product [Oikopleura dioica]|uniref:Hexosyltransferase n=1 Tax=Oikopleura dioica TaxID=34765 RepID=E4XQS9_OIKDI|nr:unnamed protein product [Oikopleura dioica]
MEMKIIYRRPVFLFAVFAIFVCSYGIFGHAKREILLDERFLPNWIFHEKMIIKSCVKKQSTLECLRYKNLELALLACEENEECNGLSEVSGDRYFFYELRKGPEIVESETNSWLISCDDENADFTFANPKELEENYPELKKQRVKNSNNECVFFGKYAHMNTILKFDPNLKPKALVSPPACFDEDLIFGIKSFPKDAKNRQILRETWLDPKIWSSLGFKIKVVFIIAQTEEQINLAEEINEKKDLLILDFPETLYNLVYKDISFLRFIENKCLFVDFVFKGDDDILLKTG